VHQSLLKPKIQFWYLLSQLSCSSVACFMCLGKAYWIIHLHQLMISLSSHWLTHGVVNLWTGRFVKIYMSYLEQYSNPVLFQTFRHVNCYVNSPVSSEFTDQELIRQ